MESSLPAVQQEGRLKRLLRVRYIVLAFLCLMYCITYIDRVNISVAAPLLRKELELSATQLGFVFSVFAYPYAAMQIVGGWLADKYGPRWVLMLLCVLWSAATALTGLTWGIASLIVFRVLLGIGEGGAFPTATRAMSFWYPVTERGFAQGITHSFARLGGAVTPPIVLAITLAYSWRVSFVVLGIASVIWAIAWFWYYRDTPAQHKRVTARELDEIGAGVAATAGTAKLPTPWRELIGKMWLVTWVDFCYGWSLWVFLTWLPSYLADARGFKLKEMALFASLPLLAGVIGDTLGGVVSDFVYRRTRNLRVARCGVLVFGLLSSLAFVLPAISVESPYSAVYLLSASFFCLELTNAVLWSLPMDIAGRFAGTAGGMMNTGFGVAGMISPLAFGFLIQSTGSYTAPFMLSAALLFIGAVSALWINPLRKLVDAA